MVALVINIESRVDQVLLRDRLQHLFRSIVLMSLEIFPLAIE